MKDKPGNQKFTSLAIAFALASIVFNILFMVSLQSGPDGDAYLFPPPQWLVLSTTISCLLGFVFTLLSFIFREPSSIIKWLAGILNVGIFLYLGVSVVDAIFGSGYLG